VNDAREDLFGYFVFFLTIIEGGLTANFKMHTPSNASDSSNDLMRMGVISTTSQNRLEADTVIGGTAGATVPAILELVNAGMYLVDANDTTGNPWGYPTTQSFDFGELQYNSSLGYFTGETYVVTMMVPVSSLRGYHITLTGSSLTGNNNIHGCQLLPEGRWPFPAMADSLDKSGKLFGVSLHRARGVEFTGLRAISGY